MPIEYVWREKAVVEPLIESVVCNKCGNRFTGKTPTKYVPGNVQVLRLEGGGSDIPGFLQDGERTTVGVCHRCLKEWFDTFLIPPEVDSRGADPYKVRHSETHEEWTIKAGWALPPGVELPAGELGPEDEEKDLPGEELHPTPGLYRHFKGNNYLVRNFDGRVWSWPDRQPMVVYQPLYGESRLPWIRPAEMWGERVFRDGYDGPRFTYIGPIEVLRVER